MPCCIDLMPCHLFVSHVLIFFLYVHLLIKWFLVSDFIRLVSQVSEWQLVPANKQVVNPHYSPRWGKLHWGNEWWISEKKYNWCTWLSQVTLVHGHNSWVVGTCRIPQLRHGWLLNEWVIKFNGLSGTAYSEVHIVHISRVITAINWNHYLPSHR